MQYLSRSHTHRIQQRLHPVRARQALATYRAATLTILVAILVAVLSGAAWLQGTWSTPATADWATFGTHAMLTGILLLLYREVWLIRWAAHVGAPYPTYRDPWGRPHPTDAGRHPRD